jgi:signal transduction histidine kinase/GAF domain-containing protein
LNVKALEHIISQLAALSQRSESLTWQSLLHQILDLFVDIVSAEDAALVLLDEQLYPLGCVHIAEDDAYHLCAEIPRLSQDFGEELADGLSEFPLDDMATSIWLLPIPTVGMHTVGYVGFIKGTEPLSCELLHQVAALVTPLMRNIRLQRKVSQERLERQRPLREDRRVLSYAAEPASGKDPDLAQRLLAQLNELMAYGLDADSTMVFVCVEGMMRFYKGRGVPEIRPDLLSQIYRGRFKKFEGGSNSTLEVASDLGDTASAFMHIADARKEPDVMADIAQWAGMRTVLWLPFQISDGATGSVVVGRRKVRPFAQEAIDVGKHFAQQYAWTFRYLRRFEASQRQGAMVDALEHARALNQSLDLEQILTQLLDQLAEVVPYDASNVMLIGEDEAYVVRWRGYDQFGVGGFMDRLSVPIDWPTLHWMAKTRTPILIADTQTSSQWIPLEELAWVRSYVAVPVVTGSEVFGFINLDSAIPNTFTEFHRQQLQAFADSAAIALQNAQFYRDVQRRAREVSTLYTVAVVFATTSDLHDALRKIVECLRSPLKVAVAWITLFSGLDSVSDAEQVDWTHIPQGMPEAVSAPPYLALYRQVQAHEKRSKLTPLHEFPPVPVSEGNTLKTYLGVPLLGRGQVLGVLNVAWDVTMPEVDEEYLALLETIGQQIGIGIDRILLFQEARRRQAYQESVNAVIAAVNQATDLDEILRVGLEQALKAMGLTQGAIYLRDPQEDVLNLRIQKGLPTEILPDLQMCRPGQGSTGRAFASQQVVLATDMVLAYPTLAPAQACALSAQISLPLSVEGRPVGVMNLNGDAVLHFKGEERQLLRAIVDQLALAVQRGQLTLQLRGQLQVLNTIYQVGMAFFNLSATRDVRFVLVRTLKEELNALAAAFYQVEHGEWRRVLIYPPYRAQLGGGSGLDNPSDLGFSWTEGACWPGEEVSLSRCSRERQLIAVSRHHRDATPSFWENVEAMGAGQVLYFPLFLPSGEFFGVVGVLLSESQDLARQALSLPWAIIRQGTSALARLQHYEAIREGESRMRAILESSQDGILLVGQDLSVRYVNQRALALLALSGSPATWEHRALPVIIAAIRYEAPALARHLVHLARDIQTPAVSSEVDIVDADVFETAGSRLLVLQHWPVYAGPEQLLGGLFLLRDVTEQKSMEQMRDDLINMLIHDMRSPLGDIQYALELLEAPDLQDARVEIMGIARSKAEQLLNLVNGILDIGRLEAGRFELYEEPVLLAYLIKRVTKTLVLKDLDLRIDLPPDLPILWVDQRLVERVFQNILENAVKFVPDKRGTIRIFAVNEGTYVKIGVYNNGPHISPALLKRLFGKFVAGGDKEKRGYGLGLAFCRLVVEAHGGRIEASNEPQGGVTLYFTLPVAPDFENNEI